MSIAIRVLIALIVLPIVFRIIAKAIGSEAVAKQPDRIRLSKKDAKVFKNPQAIDTFARALAWKGFKDAGIYAVDAMPSVHLQLLADQDRSILATIYEHAQAGQWIELTTRYEDGTTASFSTMRPTGLSPRPGHLSVHAPGLDPAALLARCLAERPSKPMKPVTAETATSAFEEGYADHIAWRKKAGISAGEVAKVATRKAA